MIMSRKKISSKARIKGPSPEQIRKRNLITGIIIFVAELPLVPCFGSASGESDIDSGTLHLLLLRP